MYRLAADEPVNRPPVCGVLVRGDAQRPVARHLDEPAEEPTRGMLVTVFAKHRIQKLTVTVDGTVQIAPVSGDLHVRLVQIPGLAGSAPPPGAQLVREQWSEAELPFADGLVRDLEPALKEHLRDIAEACSAGATIR